MNKRLQYLESELRRAEIALDVAKNDVLFREKSPFYQYAKSAFVAGWRCELSEEYDVTYLYLSQYDDTPVSIGSGEMPLNVWHISACMIPNEFLSHCETDSDSGLETVIRHLVNLTFEE
jgi:hypothetical protein